MLFSDAYDALDPYGNITIKWDIKQWTGDGYVVSSYYAEICDAKSQYMFLLKFIQIHSCWKLYKIKVLVP